ncbi:MAG TPA: SDR family oxidoreductase [Gammaproteobacteria bacterium]|nr:SDR family oxidoreductase [Gammaproteobacteria bacterium]
MNPSNARVLVTGAAGGIGSAIAKQLAKSGATLLLTDLRQEPLDRLATELSKSCVNVTAVAADITAEQGRNAVLASARELCVNVVINAAGVNPFGLLASQASAEIGKTMLINAVAPMLLCQAMIPLLSEREAAHIINVGSTFGSIGFPGFCTYSASKFAIRGFSEALRRELADTHIRVHYVAPRATRTALATDRIRAMNEELKVGMDSPQTVALAIEAVLRTERREFLLGIPERLFAKINGLWPGLVDRSLRNQLSIIKRYATATVGRPHLDTPPVSINA